MIRPSGKEALPGKRSPAINLARISHLPAIGLALILPVASDADGFNWMPGHESS